MGTDRQNLLKVGNSLFNKDFEDFITKQPYMAFVVLSAILDFIGHCFQMDQSSSIDTVKIFYDVINNINALSNYRDLNYNYTNKKDNEINSNYLYKYLRCGMVHELLPKGDIVLSPDRNDLSKRIVGAKELYEDMKKAWEELKSLPDVSSYMEATDALKVVDVLSGSTISASSMDQSTTQN